MLRFAFLYLAATLHAGFALAELQISEFMAQNASGLEDAEGEHSDWIEIYNPGAEPVSLEGYSLTDSKKNLDKWKFPKVTLQGGAYLVVFASGKAQEKGTPNSVEENRQLLIEAGFPEPLLDRMSQTQLEDLLRAQLRRPRPGGRFAPQARPLHTNFKLSAEGEYLALVEPDGKTVSHAYSPKYPRQRADVSYGIIGENEASTESKEGEVGYLLEPTPGEANAKQLKGFIAPLHFSHNAGYFEEPFYLSMESATPGVEIRYTLDGDTPGPEHGAIYSEPLYISKSTVLRAASFKKDYRSDPVVTRTFLFLDDVLHQSPNGESPAGWPGNYVNGQHLDYGMDPAIVGGEYSLAEVKEALQALPAMSLVAPLESLFDRRTGIYVNAGGRGRQWERVASLELLPTDGSPGFQVDGGLRVRGGFSRQGSNPKHGFRLIFRKEYGAGKLKYPLFESEGAEEFDKIDLRSSMNYSWAMGGDPSNTLLRDVFSRDTQRDMGQPYTRSRFYHLYLNGHYWGIYMTQERSEAAYGATYFGGDKADYDTIKTFGEVTDGNGDARGRLYRAALEGFAKDEDYFRIQGMNVDGSRNPEYERLVDIDNVVDYMLITFYTGDKDGPGGTFAPGNNYYSLYNRKNPDGFKFFEHDSEHSLGLGVDDITGSFIDDNRRISGSLREQQFNVHWLHTRFVANHHYHQRFTERTMKHLFEGGALTPEACLARLEAREKTIDRAIIAHAARWGDAKGSPPKTREDWLAAVSVIKSFISTRRETLLRQLYDRGWYTGLPAPAFNRPGGVVSRNFKLFVLDGEGDLFVTTDGSDPRDPSGEPGPTAFLTQIPSIERTSILEAPSPARAVVPSDDSFGLRWTLPEFDDRAWTKGKTGMGYEAKSGYENLIGIDLRRAMHQRNTTAYLRVRFPWTEPGANPFDELSLKMRFDDGFIAYLNGIRVAAANAPERPNWRSTATADHPDEQAKDFVPFPFENAPGLLRPGENLLAIHGMDGASSSDFIITPAIEGIRYAGADPIPIKAGETTVRVRSRKDGEWSPLAEKTFHVN